MLKIYTAEARMSIKIWWLSLCLFYVYVYLCLIENLVITDFIKWGINQAMPPSFYFWQKSHASEIDLVISSRGMTIPVEIKYSSRWDKKYLHSIDMFKEKHRGKGLKIPFSLVIYRGDFMVPREDVFCIPVWVLC